MSQKSVLITGAAGFIGSHLCERFVDDGYFVIGIDNFITGNPDNLADLMRHGSFEFRRADACIVTEDEIGTKCDIVMHMAGIASPVDYVAFPIETLKVGSTATFNMLDLANKWGSKFVLASTSEVYGNPLVHPQVESYFGNVNPIGPRSMYDESKRFSEALTTSYKNKFGLDTKIIRIFNTYGPRMRPNDGRVVPNFIVQALNNTPLTVYGTGLQTRSLCYVSDLVNGIVQISNSDFRGVVNLGNPNEMTVIQIATAIRDLVGSSSEIVFMPASPDDPERRNPDISIAHTHFNWLPKIALEDGLKFTIEYFANLATNKQDS